MNIKKSIVILFIACMPYNNFPIVNSGTLKPLAIVPIFLCFIYLFLIALKNNRFMIDEFTKFLGIFFVIFLQINLVQILLNYDFMINSKEVSPFFRLVQFLVFSGISIGSLIIGKYSMHSLGKDLFFKSILFTFSISLIFGLLEIFTNNHSILSSIRKLLASTEYPAGYYRIYLLTTEPSFAAFDLAVLVMPVTLYIYLKTKKIRYILLLVVEAILLMYTKSLLGYMLAGSFICILLLYMLKLKNLKKNFLVLISLLISLPIAIYLVYNSNELEIVRYRLDNFLSGADNSAATRTVSYTVAVKILEDNPITGIGFRNAGYYYSNYVDTEDRYNPLVNDWASSSSNRFADVKSTVLEILVSSGILGAIFLAMFVFKIYKYIKVIKKSDDLLGWLFATILILSFIGSFSINLIGYPLFWYILGGGIHLAKKEYEEFKVNEKSTISNYKIPVSY